MEYVFSKNWFVTHQRKLLWLANTKIGRGILGIDRGQSDVGDNKIKVIFPNLICWQNEDKSYSIEVRTNDRFARVIYNRFRYIWQMFHWWDMNVANQIKQPALNFGFDTLTAYPDPNSGATTCDGDAWRSANETFSAIRGGAGTNASTAFGYYITVVQLGASATTNQYEELLRGFFSFDISALPALATISSATFSLKGQVYNSGLGDFDVHLAESTQSNANNVVASDYSNVNRISFGSLNQSAFDGFVAYKDFTINSSGISYLSGTSIAMFSTQSSWDINNAPPSWASEEYSYINAYSAERTGTADDPKLTITYSVPSGSYVEGINYIEF